MSESNKDMSPISPEKGVGSEFIINREDEKIFGPEKKPQDSFEKKIEDLINPPEGKDKVIKNDDLHRLATAAAKPWNQTPKKLDELLKAGNDWYLDSSKKIPEEEWEILAGLIYGRKSQLEIEQLKKTSSTVSSQGPAIDFELLINKISEGQKNFQENLLKAFKDQKITLEQLLNLSQKPVEVLTDSFKRVPPKEERKRWVDVEYRQEFWTKFTPSMEPRFYTELEEEERRLFDTRWQLARAAYYKKATVAFPEKMIENQDLIMLGMEQMEKLYKIPGVKDALSWYAKKIVLDKTFWDCKNEIEFEQIRKEMRGSIKKNTKEIKEEKNREEQDRLVKDADAVAWNLMWVSNLVESADSRYSKGSSGGRHDGLPGVLASDDLRAVFHSQEKFENKCTKRQEWGVFGKWGVVQMSMIENQTHFNRNNDVFEFKSFSSMGQFWRPRRTGNEIIIDGKKKEIIEVFTPECYPTTSMKSFWEEMPAEDDGFKKELVESGELDPNEKLTLLHYLLHEKEIHWREIKSAFWVDYLPIKLNKAVKLLDDYFKGKAHLEEGDENEWVKPLTDIFVRLKLDKDKKTFHNLKVWSVYAGIGGVIRPDSKTPALPLKLLDRAVMEERLRRPDIRFLERGERLNLSY